LIGERDPTAKFSLMSLLRKEGVYYYLPFVRGDTEGFIMGFGLRRYGIDSFLIIDT
jgi:hypothetical protein